MDPLRDYFKNFFLSMNLVDIGQSFAQPTWRNNRHGDDANSKRIDHFFIVVPLIDSMERYMTWVEYESFSEQSLIVLELDLVRKKGFYPFNFNHSLLQV